MSGMTIGLMMFSVLLLILALRVHIGIAMFIVGSAGFLIMNDYESLPLLAALKNVAYARFSNYDLAVIPLFMLVASPARSAQKCCLRAFLQLRPCCHSIVHADGAVRHARWFIERVIQLRQ